MFGATMSQGTSNDSVGDLRYDAERSISLVEADVENSGIEGVRSTVSITREAARAISITCLLYTSPSPRDGLLSRMPSSA